jgi:hypothetical protein
VRHFVAILLAVTLLLSITTLSVSASTLSTLGGHGCAPLIPPGVPGTLKPPPAVPGAVVINEVLLAPHSTWNCSENSGMYSLLSDTWIELYNTQNQPYNLYAANAEIDSGPNTNVYHLPFAASIAAHGFLVLFPRYDAGFLSTETSTLRLLIGDIVVDYVTIPLLTFDQSYARTANGASSWQVTANPTIDASNATSQATPTTTSGQNGSGGNAANHGLSGDKGTNTSKALVNGVQPQWSNLQLPAVTPTTSAIYTAPITISTAPLPGNNGLDMPRRITLIALLIALALTMLWCWRAFFKARSTELRSVDPPGPLNM